MGITEGFFDTISVQHARYQQKALCRVNPTATSRRVEMKDLVKCQAVVCSRVSHFQMTTRKHQYWKNIVRLIHERLG